LIFGTRYLVFGIWWESVWTPPPLSDHSSGGDLAPPVEAPFEAAEKVTKFELLEEARVSCFLCPVSCVQCRVA
jgi:hypothetical protein